MVLRFSRICFWLAALAAALALSIPGGYETLLTGASLGAALSAWLLWRIDLKSRRSPLLAQDDDDAVPTALSGAALTQACSRLEQEMATAPSFAAALLVCARILKSELGARSTAVYSVRQVGAAQAVLAERVADAKDLHLSERVVRLDTSSLGRALQRQQIVLELPESIVLPVEAGGSVLVLLELRDLQIEINADALDKLLICAARLLLQRASVPQAARVDDNAAGRDRSDGDPDPTPDRPPSPLSSMPTSPFPPRDPARALVRDRVAPLAGARASSGVLDAVALGRLTEIDPRGEHKLLQRVLTAYQNSAARLLPQLHAARRDVHLDGIVYVAHTLKSSSASIGAIKFAALCAEIESMIRVQQLEGLDARLDLMCGELEIVLKAVTELLDGKP